MPKRPAPADARIGPAEIARQPLWIAVLLACLLATGIWTLSARAQRHGVIENETAELVSLVAALSAQTESVLERTASTLRATAEDLESTVIDPRARSDTSARHLLQRRLGTLPGSVRWQVCAGDGSGLAGSAAPGSAAHAVPSDCAREPALAARTGAEGQLLLGPLQAGTEPESPHAIAVAMRWNDHGTPGVIVVQMRGTWLDDAFARSAPGPDAAMALHLADGQELGDGPATQPRSDAPPQEIHARWGELPVDRAVALALEPQRLTVVQRLAAQPLLLLISRDREALLRDWRDQTLLEAALMASTCLAALGLAWQHVREGLRRTARREADRIAAERQSREREMAQRWEALGTLAGGVAHDFNNVLAAVIGFAERAQETSPAGSAQHRHLDQVLQAGARGRALVQRVLAYGREPARQSVPVNLAQLLRRVSQALSAQCDSSTRVRLDVPDASVTVRADESALFEALTNLGVNGLQAMQDAQASGELHLSLKVQDGQARLRVRDHGPGLSAQVRSHLFEPFFTTRSVHAGTGLGLAMARRLIERLGGTIEVEDPDGAGACFCVTLPLQWEGTGAMAEGLPPTVPRGDGQVIAVIDDEPALRELMEDWLAQWGYEPRSYAGAQSALSDLLATPQIFDLVLTDQRMPGMTGQQLIEQLRGAGIGLPIVLMSGYADDEALVDSTRPIPRLSKPLDRDQLARTLAQQLQRIDFR